MNDSKDFLGATLAAFNSCGEFCGVCEVFLLLEAAERETVVTSAAVRRIDGAAIEVEVVRVGRVRVC